MSQGMKFRVASEEHSRLIQEWLFDQGYSWGGSDGKQPRYTEQKFLFAYNNSSKLLTHDNNVNIFNSKPFIEQLVTTTTKTTLVIRSVTPKREKVIVFGRTYYKDDVDVALSKLEVATV